MVGRLTTGKTRVCSGQRRIGSGQVQDADRFARRDRSKPWRKWYSTKAWRDLRKRVLLRDQFVCQQTGVMLKGKYPAPDSPVADHIKPHRGDRDLFFNIDNVQAVSKAYHDQEKQRLESLGLY